MSNLYSKSPHLGDPVDPGSYGDPSQVNADKESSPRHRNDTSHESSHQGHWSSHAPCVDTSSQEFQGPKNSTYPVERKAQRGSKDANNKHKEAGAPDFYPAQATRNPATKDLKPMFYKYNASPGSLSTLDPPKMSSRVGHDGGTPQPFDDRQHPGHSPGFIEDSGDSHPSIAWQAPDNNRSDEYRDKFASGVDIYPYQFKSNPDTLHKKMKGKDPSMLSGNGERDGSQIAGSKPIGAAPYPLAGLNAIEPESDRTPGAYREGGSESGHDSDNYTTYYEGNVARATNDAEDPSELPVAFPAELVKDTTECFQAWWSKPRNRLTLIVGVTLIIGGFVGLMVALILKSEHEPVKVAAVPSCVGAVALAWGEPHLTTFDNLKYDCQGEGEFVLVHSRDGHFEVQARFSALDHDDRTSKITAVAISEGVGTTVVQLSIPENTSATTEKVDVCLLDLWVNGTHRSIYEGAGQDDVVEVTVSGKRVNILYKSTGAAVTVDIMSSSTFECFLNTFVCLPDSLFDAIGLMGTPNKVIADDWMDQDGNSLQLPTSPDGLLYEVAYEYCTMNWCLQNESDSLFSYEHGFDFNFYQNCNAAYPGSVTSEEASDELIARCEGNTACVTEGLIGGDEGTENALKVVAELEETRDRSNVTSETTESPTKGPATESPTPQPTTPKPLTPTPATSPPPTQQPQTPISTSAPVPTVVGNERCEDAMTLLVDGSTPSVSNSESSHTQGTCGSTSYEGSVSWFTFIGTGRRVKISTCTDETDPTIDTYVAVFTSPSGSCGASDWTCVVENDNDEGRCPEKPTASTLFLNSIAGQQYYVTMIGINNATGNFGLLLTDESNGCNSAQNILVDGTVTVGSNENGTSVGGICDREDYTPEDYHGLGVWYSFTGTGRRVKISTCTNETDAGFDTYIAVYSSTDATSCDASDWNCISENGSDASQCSTKPKSSTLLLDSIAGQKYDIVVIGNNNAIGTFGLILEDEGGELR